MAVRSIRTAELRADCATLARDIRGRALATDDELARHAPGGPENPDTTARGWLRYFAVLHRFHVRGETRDVTGSADREVLAALSGDPIRVELLSPPAGQDGVYVYPPSLETALHVAALDAQVAWLTAQRLHLLELATPKAMSALPHVLAVLAYTYQLIVWCLVSEGPAMPYAVTAEDPTPPDWIRALEPYDVLRICRGHSQHLVRLSALSALIDHRRQDQGGLRPSWSAFVALTADGEGVDPLQLKRHRSLHAMLAKARLVSAAHQPATADAGAGS